MRELIERCPHVILEHYRFGGPELFKKFHYNAKIRTTLDPLTKGYGITYEGWGSTPEEALQNAAREAEKDA
jgi:hypothetical protein